MERLTKVERCILDIDECTLGLHNCPPTAKCINFAGGFRCSCVAGFHDAKDGCQDIDECSLGLHNCDVQTEECKETPGSYTCHCRRGYVRRDGKCVDDDECLRIGSSRRKRQADSAEDSGLSSQDVASDSSSYTENVNDDLLTFNSVVTPCDYNARCINTEGSYFCKCKSGFAGNGIQDRIHLATI